MKPVKLIVSIGFLLSLCAPTSAQVTLDVSKITCWQFATYKITNPQLISVWVSGYFHGKAGDTMIDPPTLVANAAKMQEYCTKNPDVPFMQAVETVLGPNK